MPLLSLPSELLIQIAECVSDSDAEANGDIVAFATTCCLLRSLSAKAVKEYLDEARQYRHLTFQSRSEPMMDMLLGIQSGSRARWHVRTLEVESLTNCWRHSELGTPLQSRIWRDIVTITPLLATFPSLQGDLCQKMKDGADTAFLALLLLCLPRLQTVRPYWYANYFLEWRFMRATEEGCDGINLSPALSKLKTLRVDWLPDGGEATHVEDVRFFNRRAFSASPAIYGFWRFPPSSSAEVYGLGLEQTKLEIARLSTFLRQFTSLTKFSCKVSRFGINWDPSEIRDLLERYLQSTIEEISMTANLAQPDRFVGSFRNFRILGYLDLDFGMFVKEDTKIIQPFSAVLPTSLKVLDIWKCFAPGYMSADLAGLLVDFEPTTFPLLGRIAFHALDFWNTRNNEKHILVLGAALNSAKVPCSRRQWESTFTRRHRPHQGLVVGVSIRGDMIEDFNYFGIGDNTDEWCNNKEGQLSLPRNSGCSTSYF